MPTARLIPIISPGEAAELTYYGSEVIHPFTMEQVRNFTSHSWVLKFGFQVIRKKISIRIKNVENPKGGGTVILPDPDIDSVDIQQEIGASGVLESASLAMLGELSLAAAQDRKSVV